MNPTKKEPEIWKDIEGYDGWYQVSNHGRVRSWRNNRWGRSSKPKILSQSISLAGYKTISLGRGNKHYVHRLISEAFIKNPTGKPQCNHIDGEKLNNYPHNLEWVTNKENAIHASKTGLTPSGGDSHLAKLKREEVIQIKKMIKTSDLFDREIAEFFDVSRKTITNIKNGQTWKNLKINNL